MTFASPETLLLLALVPPALLIAIGVVPSVRSRLHWAIPATALATGLALLVVVFLVVGAYSFDALYGVADSRLILFGLPLASFAIALGVLAYRGRLTLPIAAACAVVGVVGLWYLGGLVAMLSACSFSRGGC